MRKYVFENATIYITEPTEAHVENIRSSTERFVKRLVKEGLISNDNQRQNNRGTSVLNTNSRQRNKEIEKKD